MSDTPIHDWVFPRLVAMVREAEALGFERSAVVAVIIDQITRPPFDVEPIAPPET